MRPSRSLSSGWGMHRGGHGKLGSHWSSPQSALYTLPWEQASCACTTPQWSPAFPTALLLVLAAVPPAKGARLPCVKPQDWGTQYVVQSSLPRADLCPCILLFLRVPSLGHRPLPDRFSSLPTGFHVDLCYSLGTGVFLIVSS